MREVASPAELPAVGEPKPVVVGLAATGDCMRPTVTDRDTVLIADDEPLARRCLQRCLQDADYDLVVACDGKQAMDLMREDVMVALLDLNMPHASGMECLKFFRERFSLTPTIIVSGQNQIKDAVAALKAGACDYVTKPFDPDELLACVAQAVRGARLAREHCGLKQLVAHPIPADTYLAKSKPGRNLLCQVARIAPLDATVLITGESGTGKSTIARMIHHQGPRAAGPFVAVNCASLPRDLIESELFGHAKGAFTGATNDRPGRAEIADGGTLFLDEIGDLPLELQPKLLTFLQERTVQRVGCNKVRHVNVRVIAATHQELAAMCAERRFREDLYYRLNVLNLHIPPLRERLEDIEELTWHVLQRISRRRECVDYGIENDALEALRKYDWPGNIRELENTLERASAFCHQYQISTHDIEFAAVSRAAIEDHQQVAVPTLAGKTLAEIEKQAIAETLTACGGNKALTARQLGISEKSIYNKMRRHGMMPKA
jgi:DNA-binding NtrC family response regulator